MAVGEAPVLEALIDINAVSLARTELDPVPLLLVRLAALAAVDAPAASYLMHVGAAAESGVTVEDVQDVLVAVAPIVGAPRVLSAAVQDHRGSGLRRRPRGRDRSRRVRPVRHLTSRNRLSRSRGARWGADGGQARPRRTCRMTSRSGRPRVSRCRTPRWASRSRCPAWPSPASTGDDRRLLAHGFQSGAVFNTDISSPAIIAYELGWPDIPRTPATAAPVVCRSTSSCCCASSRGGSGPGSTGGRCRWRSFRAAAVDGRDRGLLGAGSGGEGPRARAIKHNLAVYGWDLRDALDLTAPGMPATPCTARRTTCQAAGGGRQRARRPAGLPDRAGAGAVADPVRRRAELGRDDAGGDTDRGIETLIVLLGANNALPSVTGLEVIWSGDGYDDLDARRRVHGLAAQPISPPSWRVAAAGEDDQAPVTSSGARSRT